MSSRRSFLAASAATVTLSALPKSLLASGLASVQSSEGGSTALLLRADDFQFAGNGGLQGIGAVPSQSYISLDSNQGDAMAGFHLTAPGVYEIWTQSYNYTDKMPGARRYVVMIDGNPAAQESGKFSETGWGWEHVGSMHLANGDHILSLRSTTRLGRPGGILLAPSGFDPTKVPVADLARLPSPAATLPVHVQSTRGTSATELGQKAVIENDALRITFSEGSKADGGFCVLRKVFMKESGSWLQVPFDAEGESLFYLEASTATIHTEEFLPKWSESKPLTISFEGKAYAAVNNNNPFSVGTLNRLRATGVTQAAANRVEIQYEAEHGVKALGVWSIDGRVQKFSVTFAAPSEGHYMVGFSPFQAWAKETVRAVQLPPLFQKQRIPSTPQMLTSSAAPHAMVLVESAKGDDPSFSYLAAADPAGMPFEWSDRSRANYGFTLLNPEFGVQPTALSPVLGLPGSHKKANETVKASFAAMAVPGDWKTGLRSASDELFRVKDYREPVHASLTNAALNMIDLMMDVKASGWDARLKGPYNIESTGTASHASPLTYFSVAALTRDENFYATRSLPTLEFLLSRASPHYAATPPTNHLEAYVRKEQTQLVFPGRYYGATFWEGAFEMSQQLNPWLVELAFDSEQKRNKATSSIVPSWSESLANYRLSPTPQRLAEVKAACDAWLRDEFYARSSKPLGVTPFYNFVFYPFWWPLLDLYDLTGEKRYLEAVHEGAFYTMAGQWSHPSIPEGTATANEGGSFPNLAATFWKGNEKYRLGLPRRAGDTPECQVPAWELSEIGLGLEQPYTYYLGGEGLRHIMNAAWAPSLLRVHARVGEPMCKTYARNTTVGRFANYPGYYITGACDVMTTAEYPYKGPDVTDIYYHHIPAHLAFTLDFVFAEAEQMSEGKIQFPWVRQQGYVWFTNRLFGAKPGKVYGEEGLWPWLDRKAFSIDLPAVNYFGARGNQSFVVVACNSSKSDANAVLKLDPLRTGVTTGTPFTFSIGERVVLKGTAGAEIPFTLPVGAVGVFKFQTTKSGAFAVAKPLAAKPLEVKLPKQAGTLHAMRIRSPFGKDSLYVFLAGDVAPGLSVRLVREGAEPSSPVTSVPYEFSVYPIAMEQEMQFHLAFTDAKGNSFDSETIHLPGTTS